MNSVDSWSRFDIELEVRTPLHIGGGLQYQRDYDFIVETLPGQGPVVRLFDVDAALELMGDEELERVRNGAIAAALPAGLYRRATRALLAIHGTRNVGQEVHAAIRDGEGRLYLPGSSLKGAFRSALLDAYARAHIEQVLRLVREITRNPGSRERAARRLENEAFSVDLRGTRPGDDAPNRDVNRVFRIGDAYPIGELEVVAAEVQVRSSSARGQQRIPIWVEALAPGSRFMAELTLPPRDFSPWNELDDERKQLFGNDLLACLRTWGDTLAEVELNYWRRTDLDVARRFEGAIYRAGTATARPLAVFPLGLGTGWLSKTIGTHIRAAPGGRDLMQQLITAFQLSRSRSPDPQTFPVGHRLIDSPGGPLPMGWVAITGARRR